MDTIVRYWQNSISYIKENLTASQEPYIADLAAPIKRTRRFYRLNSSR